MEEDRLRVKCRWEQVGAGKTCLKPFPHLLSDLLLVPALEKNLRNMGNRLCQSQLIEV